MKTTSSAQTPHASGFWSRVAGPRRAAEASHGWHESSLELQQGLEVRETPLHQLPLELVRQFILRRNG